PRASVEPPRRFRSCGVSPVPLSRRSLRLALQSAARRNETDETMFTITKKNEPLIKHVDQWFVFHLG
ncbi:hypothetical protein, partial [Priestia megaterium]|uniref:hypothetical protein n=1 Tax=Priestia megaterium TaxID=1404 RepID=UPI002D7F487F